MVYATWRSLTAAGDFWLLAGNDQAEIGRLGGGELDLKDSSLWQPCSRKGTGAKRGSTLRTD